MKNLRFLASALLFSLLSIAVLSGCGDDGGNNGNSCNSSQDCIKPGVKTDQVCANLTQKDTSGKYIGGGMCYNSCKGTGNEATGEPKKDTSLCDAKSACVYFGDLTSSDPKVRKTWNPTCIPKCNKDSDCGNHDLTCVTYDGQNVCIAKQCKNDSECDQSKGQTCGKTSGICQAKASGSIKPVTAKQCSVGDTSKCSATHPELFSCVSNKCVDPALAAVVIVDTTPTTDASACKADSDAGSDITGVYVSATDGTVKAWLANKGMFGAKVQPKGKIGDNYWHPNSPDGSAPTKLSGKPECLGDGLLTGTKQAQSWSSIGCGGKMALTIPGSSAALEPITKSDAPEKLKKLKISVYEFDSAQCTSSGAASADQYDVYGCVTTNVNNESGFSDALTKKECVKLNKAPLKGYAEVEWDPSTF